MLNTIFAIVAVLTVGLFFARKGPQSVHFYVEGMVEATRLPDGFLSLTIGQSDQQEGRYHFPRGNIRLSLTGYTGNEVYRGPLNRKACMLMHGREVRGDFVVLGNKLSEAILSLQS